MSAKKDRYIPALRFRWLTPLYDPLLKWGMGEESFKKGLIEQANILPGQRVLDLGCGTGTLTILIGQRYPQAEIVGIDGDSAVLKIAQSKAESAGVKVVWDFGLAFELPYPDGSFDRVLSSLVTHHLSAENKRRTFGEVWRVLRPGGEFHIADFGKPRSAGMRLLTMFTRRLEETKDNFEGLLPGMLREAGFLEVAELKYRATLFGPLTLIRARKAQPARN